MKVLHVPYTYYPDPVGGTEIYVEALAQLLRKQNVESVICAPGPAAAQYVHASTRVRRFSGAGAGFRLEYGYGDGDPVASTAFHDILEDERPDVVHLHAHTAEISVRAAAAVKGCGIPLVFTYHTATATCHRGTLLRWGTEPCAGKLDAKRCAACTLQSLGMPRLVALAVAQVPTPVGMLVRRLGVEGPARTALRMHELIERKHRAVDAFLRLADAIVAPSRWVRQLLLMNGIAPARIVQCGQGVSHAPHRSPLHELRGRIRVVALARLDPSKGVHLLVQALADRPDLDVELDVYGTRQDATYERWLAAACARDSRIRLLPAIAHDDVPRTIARYDAVAIPSQVTETGPLVLLEAFAAGVPVLASNLGGMAERVANERDGLLLPAFDVHAWSSALERIARDGELLPRLRAGIRPVPSMEGVSNAMHELYERVCAGGLAPPRRVPARPALPKRRAQALGQWVGA